SPTLHIYTLSLHDALPICNVTVIAVDIETGTEHFQCLLTCPYDKGLSFAIFICFFDFKISLSVQLNFSHFSIKGGRIPQFGSCRSEEHTSELQSRENLVCR